MEKTEAKLKAAPIEPIVFFPSLVLVALFGGAMAFFPDVAGGWVNSSYAFIMKNLTSMFMLIGVAAFVCVAWLGFGRYGHVRLGGPDDQPEFSKISWISMLFCAGIGIGLMIWSIVEPIYYLNGPPMGIEPMSDQALVWAHMLPQFHWGFSAWAIYCLPTVPIAYSVYVRREKIFRISDSCRPILKKHSDGLIGKVIEVFVLLGTVGAVGTSLGLAIPLISRLLSSVLGLDDDMAMKGMVTFGLFLIFGFSVYLGLEKGMQNLTRINVWLAFIILGLVLFLGPTGFIFDLWTNSIGLLLNNFPSLTFQTEPLRLVAEGSKDAWPQWWTVFYWAWWVAYAPVIALFVARISKGRTIRELVIAECIWGTLGCWAFLAIFGAYSLYAQKTGLVDAMALQAAQGDPAVCMAVMSSLPLKWIVVPIYTILCFVFLGTTLDASSQALANICSKKGYSDLPSLRWNRMLWASLLAVFGMGILITGGEKALKTVQTSTIVGGVILVPIIFILVWGLFRSLKEDFGGSLTPKTIISPLFLEEKTAKRPPAPAGDQS
ncbi:MAG: BCCT family transporter [Candidatus Adiutrix sp.]|jgi:BCCT family betaine/carnitine transporter|nr:BCCT family transporter [Candidatus Adiutrix sp.]